MVAAGWYTLPVKRFAYPLGIKLKHEFNDIDFIAPRFLRSKFKVYIGSKDTKREPSLNKSTKIDKTQGMNRLERASKWIEFMHHEFNKHNIKNSINIEILDGAGHDFNECVKSTHLPSKVMQWIYND